MKEHIIFNSEDFLEDEDEDNDRASMYFQDECMNLDKELEGRVIAVADLGLWNGRHSAYRICGHNLNEIMDVGNYDYIKIYSDGKDICKTSIHHDGTNRYIFREVRENRNIDNLTNLLYNGEYVSRQKLNYYTKSLAPYVKDVYGW